MHLSRESKNLENNYHLLSNYSGITKNIEGVIMTLLIVQPERSRDSLEIEFTTSRRWVRALVSFPGGKHVKKMTRVLSMKHNDGYFHRRQLFSS